MGDAHAPLVKKLGICLLPLLLTPIFLFAIADGVLNFGGGEKNILLLIPWLIWSFFYAVFFIIWWARKNNQASNFYCRWRRYYHNRFDMDGAAALDRQQNLADNEFPPAFTK